ncbi:hypothetical protein CUMW_116390 [Citrus unshiu]|nr:hypothetical protein CUMW_116390 [Citrus unshiu]
MFPELIQNDPNDVGFLNHFTKCYKERSMSSGRSIRVLEMLKARLNLVHSLLAFYAVMAVKLVKDEITKKSKGYAFIQYTSQDDALLALESMDHKNLDGRLIYVDIAKPGKDRFGGYPRTSGPPKQQPLSEQDEVADCWY